VAAEQPIESDPSEVLAPKTPLIEQGDLETVPTAGGPMGTVDTGMNPIPEARNPEGTLQPQIAQSEGWNTLAKAYESKS
jgi:hypothetical protein